MTKLESYERALTLYGRIFMQINGARGRFFFATIKRDFVFFLFALIYNKHSKSNVKSKSRILPKNFNEWTFAERSISFDDNDSSLWNADREYLRKTLAKNKPARGKKIAVLGYGVDLEKSFDIESLCREKKIAIVFDWDNGLVEKNIGNAKVVKKYILTRNLLAFFLQNMITLFTVYFYLHRTSKFDCGFVDFLRYFVYYAFASARIRAMIADVAKDSFVGRVMSSDLDNVVGNSLMLWSNWYGLAQIAYPHGSPLVASRNRYFEPEEYYIWTIYQKKHAEEFCQTMPKIIFHSPSWIKTKATAIPKKPIKNIIIVTAMEENLEVPLSDRSLLLDYIEKVCLFALRKNLSVYLKSHKLLDWHDDYDNLCKKYNNLTHVKKRWNNEQLRKIDIGILMNTSTTMALQLMYLGIPTISCAQIMPEITTKHFQTPTFNPQVSSKAELLTILRKLCSQEEGYYKEVSRKSQEIFAQILLSESDPDNNRI